ncbi:S24 family peptidase [Aquimarina algiphila]|uniref:S24 family peptidase n=1 Tax=Aquimarina algiphila TaxID=2047982 RepID=UPI00232B1B6B|nr:S24 family peptidase [Aquimarina algiphila]
METKSYQSNTYHQGHILKKYVTAHGINRKGGIKTLAKALGLTRQGIYVLYDQEVIKEKYRNIIIEHLELQADFFPKPLKLKDQLQELNEKYIQSRLISIDLQEQLLQAESRNLSRLYIQSLNKKKMPKDATKVVKLVNRKSVDKYVNHFFDVEYLESLPSISLPCMSSGFAFEVEGDTMNAKRIYDGDILTCNELVEQYDTIEPDTPYVIVIKETAKNTNIVCRYVKLIGEEYCLVSADNETPDLCLSGIQVKQVWKIKGKYTPDISFNS